MRITFPILLITVAVFGLGLGVSYAGGRVTERARDGQGVIRLESSRPPGAEAATGGAGAGAQGTSGGPGGFGQRGGAGSAGQQGLAMLESLVGPEGRPLAEGTIETVADGQITLKTASSQTQVRLQDGAKVAQMVNGSSADLKPGLRVIIIGQRQADGTLTASRILVPLP